MQEIILDSLVPIFFGMALGCLGGWTHHVDNRDVAQLNVLVMNFALPAAVFAAVAQQSRREAYKKPIVLAPMLAVLFVLTDIGLPESLIKSLSLMGEVARGAALFLTGLILSAQKVRLGASVASQTLPANVAHPLITAGLARLFAVFALTAREAVVLSALPAGFFRILFWLRFGTSSEVTGTTLIASTISSAATLAAAIYFTTGIGQQ